MIKLYQFPSVWGLPNISTFCLKLETYMRMAQVPYKSVYIHNPQKGPKCKLPYIDDNGTIIGDSNLIIQHLKQNYGDPLDHDLKPEERAKALTIRVLCEEYLYWMVLYSRWQDDAFWPQLSHAIFGKLPLPIKWFVPSLYRKKVLQQLRSAGMGRHKPEEVYAMADEALLTLSTILGTQPYMLGARPRSVDAAVYGVLANIFYPPLDTPIKTYARQCPNLLAYCQQMKGKYF